MYTQTHMLLGSALFSKAGKGNSARNWAIIIGAIIPDSAIFLMFFWSKIIGADEREVWNTWYYNPPWSTVIDAMNAIPILALTAMIGFVLYSRNKSSGINAALLFGSLAAIIHLLLDLPLHVDDAHAHFWPLSHWKFVSPISYWDPAYYGQYWTAFEAVIGIILAVILWRRFSAWWVRIPLALALVTYIAVPIYFIWSMGMPNSTI